MVSQDFLSLFFFFFLCCMEPPSPNSLGGCVDFPPPCPPGGGGVPPFCRAPLPVFRFLGMGWAFPVELASASLSGWCLLIRLPLFVFVGLVCVPLFFFFSRLPGFNVEASSEGVFCYGGVVCAVGCWGCFGVLSGDIFVVQYG